MKKLFLFLLTVSLFSCSGDDSNESDDNKFIEYFHPPTWIQGTWKKDEGVSYKFTTNDFCIITTWDRCYREDLNLHHTGDGFKNVDETISPNIYKLIITAGNTTATLKFEKINDTQIKQSSPGDEPIILTKQ